MTILRTADPSEASGDIAAIYAEDLESLGYIPEHTRVMALNPEAYRAWESLSRAIAPGMGKRRYELVTLAAARGTHSAHCRLAHGARALGLSLFDDQQLERVARDYREADLTDAEVAMMSFAERVSGDSYAMTDADAEALRHHGFTDREIVDIALAAAARNYFSRAIQALGVAVDVPPALTPELADALTSGL
ncbi:peroxidase-related enzyme [Gryllotalpicola reticulitermitis]|uniref:Peroxidase-related enzyme n=1 Tax=Gryllotalpicola reticulitermitis TaxID=1184153 RepID=A0ABV8Q8W4_9MICO